MQYLMIGYFAALFLKIVGAPGFKKIGWGWFILGPIILPILKLLWMCLSFIFWAAVALGGIYLLSELIIWMTN